MSEKIKETVLEDAQQAKILAQDAIRSGAYLYPLKGIAYYITHRSLWKPLLAKLAPTVGLGLGVTAFMFTFTYLPQAAFLALLNGPLAIVTTVLLVLSESSTIFNVLSKNFLIDDALIDTFDGTLVSRSQASLVAHERQVGSGRDPIARMGKLVSKPFQRFTPKAMIRYFVYLPLNFIPVVGTVLFVILQGKRFGPVAHARYFQLKHMNNHQRDKFVDERRAAYTSFGVPATLLEMIPIAGIFFSFTNVVGAALWAADMEEKSNPSSGLREQARLAEGSSTGVNTNN